VICAKCQENVEYVLPVFKQLYDEQGIETGVADYHYCISCIQNLDAEDNIGIPRSK